MSHRLFHRAVPTSPVSAVWLPLLVSTALAPSLSAQERPSLGPLPASEQNPLYRLQITPAAEGADIVPDGTVGLSFRTSYSNIFELSVSESHEQLFDLEQMSNVLGVRYGLDGRWEVGGEIALHTGWGGIFDGAFSTFHQGLGLPNGGRESEPSGQHRVVLEGEDPDVEFTQAPRTLGLEGVTAFAKWQPVGWPGSPYGLSLRAAARRASGPMDAGRVDGAASIHFRMSGQEEYDGIHLYGSVGLVRLDPPKDLAPLYSDWAGTFLFGSERRFESGLSFLLQLSSGTPYVSAYEVGELTRFPMLLSVGFAGEVSDGWRWHVGFNEDFPPESPSADLTLVVNLARSLAAGS